MHQFKRWTDNPKDVWKLKAKEALDNLKKSGAFITGIRPGEQTAKHIDKVMSRLTMSGALYITAVCLIPLFGQTLPELITTG